MKAKEYIIKIIREELENFEVDDIITDDFLEQHQMDSGELEYLFDQYKYENEYIDRDIDYDDYMEDESNKKDFENWLKFEFQYKFDDQKRLYEKLFTNGNGRITIFRAMKVSKSWLKSLNKPNAKLGIYWSYEEDAAEPHWGYGSGGRTETVLLQTSVTDEQIDWNGTFEANLHPSLGEQEKEIRLKEGEKIHLEALWLNNDEINLNKTIKSNIYLA